MFVFPLKTLGKSNNLQTFTLAVGMPDGMLPAEVSLAGTLEHLNLNHERRCYCDETNLKKLFVEKDGLETVEYAFLSALLGGWWPSTYLKRDPKPDV
jgi:hypothetical protein